MEMHSLVHFVLISCCIQVGRCSVTRNVFTEKWEKHVVETAQRVFTCPGVDGIYASPQQCAASYYQCLDGIAYPQTCPAGNVFDPVTFVCTPSSQASCNQELDCSSDGLFPYPGACTNLYYVCSAGDSYVQYCPDNYVFDPLTLRCVAVENASCTTSISTTTTSTTPSTVTTQTTPRTTTPATTTGTSITPETAPTTTETSTIPTTTTSSTSTTVPTTTPETSSTTTPSIPPTKWTTSTTTPIPSSMSTITPTTSTMRPTTTVATPTTTVATPTTTPASSSTVMETTTKVTPTTIELTTSPTMTIPLTTSTTVPTSTPTMPLGTAEVTTTKLTTTPSATTPTTPTTAPPAEFACSRTGNYPYPGNCGLYYVCGGGVYIVAACPDGQVFDPFIKYCENPINVPGCETWAV